MNIPKVMNANSFKGRMSMYAPVTVYDAKNGNKIDNCYEPQVKELGMGLHGNREVKIDSKQITNLTDSGFRFKTKDGNYNVDVSFNKEGNSDINKQQYVAQMMTLANQYDQDDDFACLLNICG